MVHLLKPIALTHILITAITTRTHILLTAITTRTHILLIVVSGNPSSIPGTAKLIDSYGACEIDIGDDDDIDDEIGRVVAAFNTPME